MEHDHVPLGEPGKPTRRVSGAIPAAIAGGLAVLFAVLNLQRVQMDWIVTSTRTPLIVVIVLFGVIGFLVGFVVANRRRR
ncbi:MAG TPA: hypothetical protein VHW26_09745 [Solirubrobacteraceae bacterium]|jgi:uncharacterized integral membrane protein|nr:hypothetical protein [Solirubrobacteraceae bacterium]